MVVSSNEQRRLGDVLPVDGFRDGAQRDDRTREQEELIDGGRRVADEHIRHELILGDILALVDEDDIIPLARPVAVFVYPFLSSQWMKLHQHQGVSLLCQSAELFLDVRQRCKLGREGGRIENDGFLATLAEQLLTLGIILMQIGLYPVLLGPSCLKHLEVAILLRQSLKM